MTSFSTARQNMVDCQVRPSDVTDIAVIEAMLNVPREDFVPAHQRAMAYLDLDLPVSATRRLLPPAVVARLLQAATIEPGSSVLVVGCATGYDAAVVSRLAGRVTATEADPALAAQARANLDRFGLTNIPVIDAAMADGAPAAGPYDGILLGGATEIAPERLYRQLAPGGRLVGVFESPEGSRAMIVTRSGDDFGHRTLFDIKVAVLPGLTRAPEFVF
jgi:protein-L-isoaspartate(D-aspartate) O-methyltransferase